MEFRNARTQELSQITALYRAAIGTPGCTWSEEYPGALELAQDFQGGNLYVLILNGTLAGGVSVVVPNELDGLAPWKCRENAAEIARVVIAREAAGQGLAVTMLHALFEKLRGEGFGAVHLSVAKCNPAAIRTYRKLGFSFLAEREMYGHTYHLCELIL